MLLDYLKVDKEDTISFGDAKVDLSMFECCGFNVAMGNGGPEIKEAADELVSEEIFTQSGDGYLLKNDANLLESYTPKELNFVYAIHRNDILYKAHEHILKALSQKWTNGLPYDNEPLQYLLIDGEFHGASVGHFRNGPYDLNDVVCDLPEADKRKIEIINALKEVNDGRFPLRFMGELL